MTLCVQYENLVNDICTGKRMTREKEVLLNTMRNCVLLQGKCKKQHNGILDDSLLKISDNVKLHYMFNNPYFMAFRYSSKYPSIYYRVAMFRKLVLN